MSIQSRAGASADQTVRRLGFMQPKPQARTPTRTGSPFAPCMIAGPPLSAWHTFPEFGNIPVQMQLLLNGFSRITALINSRHTSYCVIGSCTV